MNDSVWTVIEGVDPATAKCPFVTEVNGQEVAVFRVNGALHATQRWCPHGNADLAQGTLLGDKIKCPKHGFMFRVTDGKSFNVPGLDLEIHAVETDGAALRIAIEPQMKR